MALERYRPGEEYWWRASADHVARYEFAATFVAGRRVLDAGTGYGYGAALLAAAGAKSVVGVDLDAAVVAAAGELFRLPNVTYVADNCEELGRVAGPVDVVCSFENIEHLSAPESFLKAAARVLAPDGVLVCSTPDRAITPPFVDGKPANPYHTHEWYADEFAALVGRHFERVEMLTQVRSGTAAVRERAVEEVAKFLRRNVFVRLGHVLGRLVGGPPRFPEFHHLANPDPRDYPIHPAAVAGVYGTPWCHVAVCRGPKVS